MQRLLSATLQEYISQMTHVRRLDTMSEGRQENSPSGALEIPRAEGSKDCLDATRGINRSPEELCQNDRKGTY